MRENIDLRKYQAKKKSFFVMVFFLLCVTFFWPSNQAYAAEKETEIKIEEIYQDTVPSDEVTSPDAVIEDVNTPSLDITEGEEQPVTDVTEGEEQPVTDVIEGEEQPVTDVTEGEEQPVTDVAEGEEQPADTLLDETISENDKQVISNLSSETTNTIHVSGNVTIERGETANTIVVTDQDSNKNYYYIGNEDTLTITGNNSLSDEVHFNIDNDRDFIFTNVTIEKVGTITTSLSDVIIDTKKLAFILSAQNILFQPDKLLTWYLKSLNATAAPLSTGSTAYVYTGTDAKIFFENMNIIATENVALNSHIIYKAETVDSDSDANKQTTSTSNNKYLVNVQDADAMIEIKNTSISAQEIKATSEIELDTKTTSVGLPIAVSVTNADAKVIVSGASKLTATDGSILLSSSIMNTQSSKAEALSYANISIAVSVTNANALTQVSGTSQLDAKKDITLIAKNISVISAKAYGVKNNETSHGLFVAVNVPNASSRAEVTDQVMLKAGGNIKVEADLLCTTDNLAQTEKESSTANAILLLVQGNGTSDTENKSVDDVMIELKDLHYSDKDGTDKNVVKDEDAAKITEEVNTATEASKDTDNKKTEEEKKEDKKNNSKNQLVGNFAVLVVNTNSLATITTSNSVTAGGKLSVVSNAASSNTTVADSSVNKKGSSDVKNGLGVAIVVQVANFDNNAEVKNAAVTANGAEIIATTGGYSYNDKTYNNQFDATAKAGYNGGNFGFGGAIVVSVINADTNAAIGNGTQKAIFILNGSDLTVKATNVSNVTIDANAYPTKVDDKKVESGTGVGAALAVSVLNDYVTSTMHKDVQIKGLNNLDVIALTEGDIKVTSTAGAKGGTAVAPVLTVNVTNSKVYAVIKEMMDQLQLAGVMNLNATSKRNSNSKADASAAAKGDNTSFGMSLAVVVNNFYQEATLESKVLGSDAINVIALGANTSKVDTKASASGAESKKDKEESKTESKEDSAQSGDAAPAAGDEGAPDAAMNNALQEVQGLSKDKAGKTDVPNKTPQKAETNEGSVSAAATLSLLIFNNKNSVNVLKDTNASNKLTVNGMLNSDVTVNADASATKSDTGIGVAVALLVANNQNIVTISGNHKAGEIEIHAFTTYVKSVDSETKKETKDEINTIKVTSQSGAGAKGTGVAGSVAIAIVNSTYDVLVNGNLTSTKGNIDVETELNQKVVTSAGASANEGGAATESEYGVGASFSLIVENNYSRALLQNGASIHAAKDMTLKTNYKAEAENSAIAGADGYDDGSETQTTDKKIEITFMNGDDKKHPGLADVVVEISVTYKENDETKTKTFFATADKNGKITLTGSDDKTRSIVYGTYTLTIKSVPTGFTLPTKTKYYFIIDGSNGNKGLKRSISIKKKYVNDYSEKMENAIDAAVAVTIISGELKADVADGVIMVVGGNYNQEVALDSKTNTTAKGVAEGSNMAAGASVALNIISEKAEALMAGDLTVTGDATIKSSASTEDIADAKATATGVKLDRYADKFNTSISSILDGSYWNDKKTNTAANDATADEEAPAPAITDTDKTITDKLYGDAPKPAESDGLAQDILKSQDVKTENVSASGTPTDSSIASGKAEDAKTDGKSEQDKQLTVAAAVAVNIIKHSLSTNVTGIIRKAGNVMIATVNHNNFQALATGATVSKGTGIAAAVAVLVNNSDAITKVIHDIGLFANKVTSVDITSTTTNNMGDDYKNKIAAQAIAGSAKGTEEGGVGAAGAIAIIRSNCNTAVEIGQGTVIYSNGDVTILANEQSKLAARAWGATLATDFVNDNNSPKQAEQGAAGVGAAIAVIYANDSTTVLIGDDVTIYGDNVSVKSVNQSVTADNYEVKINLNGTITIGTGSTQQIIEVNTTSDKQSTAELKFEDLVDNVLNLANILASKNYYVEAASGTKDSNSKFNGAGSVAVIYFNNEVLTTIGKNFKVVAKDKLEVNATSGINASEIAGAVQIGGSNGAGLSAGAFLNTSKTNAVIGDGLNVKSANGMTLSADAVQDTMVILLAASSADKMGGAGALSVVKNHNEAIAKIGDYAVIDTFGNVIIAADSNNTYLGIIGGANKSGSLSIGASIGVAIFTTNTEASIGDMANISCEDLMVNANAAQKITEIVVNGGLATGDAGTAVSVSPAVAIIRTNTKAFIGTSDQDHSISSNGTVKIEAIDDTKLTGIGGGAAISTGGNSVGGSIFVTVLNKNVNALLDATQVKQSAGIEINANAKEEILIVCVGLGGGASNAVAGSVNVMVHNNQVKAASENSALLLSSGDITVRASDDVKLIAVVGGIGGAGSNAVGVANNDLIWKGSTSAGITGNTRLEGNHITVDANSNQDIKAVVISGGAAGSVTVTGSVNVIVFHEKTVAELDSKDAKASGDICVQATDDSKILDAVGTLGGAGSVAVGVSSDTLSFHKNVAAKISKGSSIDAVGNVIVLAESKEDLTSVVAGISGSGSTAVNGSVSVIVLNNEVTSEVGEKSNVKADGSLAVSAEDQKDIFVLAGAVSASGGAAASAGVSVITIQNQVDAHVGANAMIDVLGTTGVSFYDGSNKKDKKTQHGVLIGAFNQSNLTVIAVAGSASGSVSLTPAVTTMINNSQTTAAINSQASINQGGREYKSESVVRVIAMDSSEESVSDGGAAIGGTAGAGAAIIVYTQEKITSANIDSSSVFGSNGVFVQAIDNNKATLNGIAVGVGGTAGVNGSVSVYTVKGITEATMSGNITSKGDIKVEALSTQNIEINEGGLSVGGVAGVGAAVITVVLNNKTIASITDGSTVTGLNVTVHASSDETVKLNAVQGAVSGTASVSGATVVLISNLTTQALIGNDVTALANQNIKIFAEDRVTLTLNAGNVSVSGFAGVGGAVDVMIFRNTVTAAIGERSFVQASNGGVEVIALSNRGITANAVAGSAGIGAVSGSVIVISVGEKVTDSDSNTALSNPSKNQNVQNTAQNSMNNAMTSSNLGGSSNESTNGIWIEVNGIISGTEMNILGYFTEDKDTANKVAASIGKDSKVEAHNSITVDAIENTTLNCISGTVAGGIAGVGGGVLITTFHGTVESYIAGNAISTNGNILVNAKEDIKADKYQAIAGTAGAVGLGASVAWLDVTGRVSAYIGENAKVTAGNEIEVIAVLNLNVKAEAFSANAAGVAVGVSTSRVKANANVGASILKNANVGAIGDIRVIATVNGSAVADSIASSGGVIAGNGSIALIEVKGNVLAIIESGSVVTTNDGKIIIFADSHLSANAIAKGISAGIVSVGANIATVDVTEVVLAQVQTDAKVTGNIVEVTAEYNKTENCEQKAEIYAGAGSLLGNVSANTATVNSNANVSAINAGQIVGRTSVSIQSDGTFESTAKAEVLNGGTSVLGVGVNVAKANENAIMIAKNTGNIKAGEVNIKANAILKTYASATPVNASGVTLIDVKVNTAEAIQTATIKAIIENGKIYSTTGDIRISATTLGSAYSVIQSVSAGLKGATVAANVSNTKINITQSAEVNGASILSAKGLFTILTQLSVTGNATTVSTGGLALIDIGVSKAEATSNTKNQIVINLDEGCYLEGTKADMKADTTVTLASKGVSSNPLGAISIASLESKATANDTLNILILGSSNLHFKDNTNIQLLLLAEKIVAECQVPLTISAVNGTSEKVDTVATETGTITFGKNTVLTVDSGVLNITSNVDSNSEVNAEAKGGNLVSITAFDVTNTVNNTNTIQLLGTIKGANINIEASDTKTSAKATIYIDEISIGLGKNTSNAKNHVTQNTSIEVGKNSKIEATDTLTISAKAAANLYAKATGTTGAIAASSNVGAENRQVRHATITIEDGAYILANGAILFIRAQSGENDSSTIYVEFHTTSGVGSGTIRGDSYLDSKSTITIKKATIIDRYGSVIIQTLNGSQMSTTTKYYVGSGVAHPENFATNTLMEVGTINIGESGQAVISGKTVSIIGLAARQQLYANAYTEVTGAVSVGDATATNKINGINENIILMNLNFVELTGTDRVEIYADYSPNDFYVTSIAKSNVAAATGSSNSKAVRNIYNISSINIFANAFIHTNDLTVYNRMNIHGVSTAESIRNWLVVKQTAIEELFNAREYIFFNGSVSSMNHVSITIAEDGTITTTGIDKLVSKIENGTIYIDYYEIANKNGCKITIRTEHTSNQYNTSINNTDSRVYGTIKVNENAAAANLIIRNLSSYNLYLANIAGGVSAGLKNIPLDVKTGQNDLIIERKEIITNPVVEIDAQKSQTITLGNVNIYRGTLSINAPMAVILNSLNGSIWVNELIINALNIGSNTNPFRVVMTTADGVKYTKPRVELIAEKDINIQFTLADVKVVSSLTNPSMDPIDSSIAFDKLEAKGNVDVQINKPMRYNVLEGTMIADIDISFPEEHKYITNQIVTTSQNLQFTANEYLIATTNTYSLYLMPNGVRIYTDTKGNITRIVWSQSDMTYDVDISKYTFSQNANGDFVLSIHRGAGNQQYKESVVIGTNVATVIWGNDTEVIVRPTDVKDAWVVISSGTSTLSKLEYWKTEGNEDYYFVEDKNTNQVLHVVVISNSKILRGELYQNNNGTFTKLGSGETSYTYDEQGKLAGVDNRNGGYQIINGMIYFDGVGYADKTNYTYYDAYDENYEIIPGQGKYVYANGMLLFDRTLSVYENHGNIYLVYDDEEGHKLITVSAGTAFDLEYVDGKGYLYDADRNIYVDKDGTVKFYDVDDILYLTINRDKTMCLTQMNQMTITSSVNDKNGVTLNSGSSVYLEELLNDFAQTIDGQYYHFEDGTWVLLQQQNISNANAATTIVTDKAGNQLIEVSCDGTKKVYKFQNVIFDTDHHVTYLTSISSGKGQVVSMKLEYSEKPNDIVTIMNVKIDGDLSLNVAEGSAVLFNPLDSGYDGNLKINHIMIQNGYFTLEMRKNSIIFVNNNDNIQAKRVIIYALTFGTSEGYATISDAKRVEIYSTNDIYLYYTGNNLNAYNLVAENGEIYVIAEKNLTLTGKTKGKKVTLYAKDSIIFNSRDAIQGQEINIFAGGNVGGADQYLWIWAQNKLIISIDADGSIYLTLYNKENQLNKPTWTLKNLHSKADIYVNELHSSWYTTAYVHIDQISASGKISITLPKAVLVDEAYDSKQMMIRASGIMLDVYDFSSVSSHDIILDTNGGALNIIFRAWYFNDNSISFICTSSVSEGSITISGLTHLIMEVWGNLGNADQNYVIRGNSRESSLSLTSHGTIYLDTDIKQIKNIVSDVHNIYLNMKQGGTIEKLEARDWAIITSHGDLTIKSAKAIYGTIEITAHKFRVNRDVMLMNLFAFNDSNESEKETTEYANVYIYDIFAGEDVIVNGNNVYLYRGDASKEFKISVIGNIYMPNWDLTQPMYNVGTEGSFAYINDLRYRYHIFEDGHGEWLLDKEYHKDDNDNPTTDASMAASDEFVQTSRVVGINKFVAAQTGDAFQGYIYIFWMLISMGGVVIGLKRRKV